MKKKPKKEYEIEYRDDGSIYIKGVGTVRETGKLNMEGLVKRLLECKYITGKD